MGPVSVAPQVIDDGKLSRNQLSLGYLSLKPLAAAFEALALLVAACASTLVYQRLFSVSDKLYNGDFLNAALVTTAIFVTVSYLAGSYDPRFLEERRANLLAGMKIWGLTLGFLALCAFLLKIGADFSRVTVLLFAALGALQICLARSVWPVLVRHAVANDVAFVSDVIVVRVVCELTPSAAEPEESGHNVLRRYGLRPIGWSTVNAASADADLAGMVEYVEDQVRRAGGKEIIILTDLAVAPLIHRVVERLRVVPVPVRVVLDADSKQMVARPMTRIGSLALVEYQRAPFSWTERTLKRGLDLAASFTGLILLSPLFVIVAIAIKIDSPGPVLFRQARRGFGGQKFMILKFRSMTVADNGPQIVQASRNDKRVTRVGRLLRRTSIDELPQLWNVFAGEMSIVGPRPHAVAHDDYYLRLIDDYAFRHHAKPGLTGWAQVKGLRGETPQVEDMRARVEKDIWYIDHWSIWLDIVIILRTCVVILGQKAY